jgi:hypothetical protein
VQPNPLEPALIEASNAAVQMLRDVSNLHEASFGQVSNEVSGRAISARQRVGELGTVVFQDNLNMAIEEAGKVINQLIPYVYDAPRVIRILQGDDEVNPEFVRINYEDDDKSVDITDSKYDITITTGPSFETKRIEAAEGMMSAVNAMPDVFGAAADLIVEAQDWPKAQELKNRLRSRMDPSLLGDDITDQQKQAMAVQQQKQQIVEKLEFESAQAEIEAKRMKALRDRAAAVKDMQEAGLAPEKAQAEIDKIYAEIAKMGADVDSQQTRDSLQAIDALTGENNV